MNKPKKSKIGVYEYEYIYMDKICEDDEETVLFGSINQADFKIEIATGFPTHKVKSTILHENIHGMDLFSQIDLDEGQVEALGNMFYMWMLDNKKTVQYLIEEEK